LRTGGVEGFIEAMGVPETATPGFTDTFMKVTRQRLSEHDHPDALADALSALPRSRPFASLADLAAVAVPAVVVASNDDADPEHPEELGLAYAQALPNARLITDPPGKSPVAWQGSQLSQIIADVVASSGLG
jgi:hypothetical protein